MLGLAFRVWNLMTTCELGTRRTNFLDAHRTLKGFARTLEGAVTHRHPWKWWRWRLQHHRKAFGTVYYVCHGCFHATFFPVFELLVPCLPGSPKGLHIGTLSPQPLS